MNKITDIKQLKNMVQVCNHNCKKCKYARVIDNDILLVTCPLFYFGDTVTEYMKERINEN